MLRNKWPVLALINHELIEMFLHENQCSPFWSCSPLVVGGHLDLLGLISWGSHSSSVSNETER